MRYILLSAVLLLTEINTLLGQGEVPVDMLTGTPTVQIPIWNVTDHDLSQPVSISYSANGTRLTEQKGIVGIGWNLQAGGSISREVRGLPDDYIGTGGDSRTGWLYNTVASDVGGFSNSADLLSSTCTDENSINTALSGFNYLIDTEPDIFHYSAGGVSGSFVFDNDLTIRMIPYRDIKIEYVLQAPPDNKRIVEFIITTNEGIVYRFADAVSTTRSTHKMPGISNVEFLRRDFAQYDYSLFNKGVVYNSEWKLSRIGSHTGAYISYQYSSSSYISQDTIRVGIRKLTSNAIIEKSIYKIKDEGSIKRLLSIRTSKDGTINFEMGTGFYEGLLSRVLVLNGNLSKEFTFEYKQIGTENTRRFYLKKLSEVAGCDIMPPYSFTYIGLSVTSPNLQNVLPSIYSKSRDFWGYYNAKTNSTSYPTIYVYPSEPHAERFRLTPIPNYGGSSYTLSGADMTPDVNSLQIGSLETVSHAGGVTSFDYEPNKYYDEKTSEDLIGPGIRIKSITYFDGINPDNNIVKNFEYMENGVSSGRLYNKPVYSFLSYEYRDPEGETVKSHVTLAAGSQQAMWEHLVIRFNRDISKTGDASVVNYRKVKVLRPNSGSAEYEHSLPAVYGATSSGDWSVTETKFARPNTCPTMGIVTTGGAWAFPVSPNPNFSYERGFTSKKTERDEMGNLLRETTWTPQYIHKSGSTTEKVWGVSYDHYANSTSATYFFGKYFLLTDVEIAVSKEEIKSYDAADDNKVVTASTEYFFESPEHKLLTRTKTTGIDGTIATIRLKYPLDYGTIPSNADIYLEKINDLQEAFRNGTPIESTTFIQKPSSSEKLVAASLVKFSDIGIEGAILPKESLSLSIVDGITDFTDSGMELDNGTYKFSHDSRYEVKNTFLKYDDYQLPLSAVGKDRKIVSTGWSFYKTVPAVSIVNARYDQYAFSDFETMAIVHQTGNEFQISSGIYGNGRTGEKALHPSVKLTRIIQKANTNNYKLTFWFKKQSSSVDFNVKIKDESTSTVYYNNTFTVNPSGANFEFFEKLVPMSGVPSSFIIELQGQNFGGSYTSSPGLLPLIDDVAFYPENADIVTTTYSLPFGPSSITNSRGVTAFTEYDNLGRVKYTLDGDKNILSKTIHEFDGVSAPSLSASILYNQPVYDLQSTSFTAGESCVDGVTYYWDFGSGYTAGPQTTTYTFTTLGINEISLKVTHPTYGEVTKTININVQPKPLTSVICAKGAQVYDLCTPGTVSSYSCAQISNTPQDTETIFKVTDTGLGSIQETIVSYQWKKRYHSSSTWLTVGFNQDQYHQTKLFEETESFDVLCVITTNTGRIAQSVPMPVTIQTCP